jgi:hypothetical protein
MSESEESTE